MGSRFKNSEIDADNAGPKEDALYCLSQSELGIFTSCAAPTTAYNIAYILPLDGLDEGKIAQAVKKVFQIHPYLFTRITVDDEGNVKKHIVPGPVEVENTAEEYDDVAQVSAIPFELTDSPLYRFRFISVGGKRCLYLDIHHIIIDGGSLQVFIDDLAAAYDGRENFRTERFSANELAEKEARERGTEAFSESRGRWQERFGGIEVSSLPPEDHKLEKQAYATIFKDLTCTPEQVRAFVKPRGLKTSALFVGAFSFLLSKVNMEKEALIATVRNGRNADNINTMGMFVRTYPLWLRFEDNDTAESVSRRAGELLDTCDSLGCYSFADAAADFGVNSDVMFAYQGDMMFKTVIGGSEHGLIECTNQDGRCPLEGRIFRDGTRFILRLEYRTDLYTDWTATQLAGLYDRVVNEFLKGGELRQIDLITETELAALDGANDADLSVFDFDRLIPARFVQNASLRPDHPLVVFKDRQYTYSQGEAITRALAGKLISIGIGKGSVVSVLIRKSEYTLLASLGVLRSGAAYQPLDPTYPPERINFMIGDASASLLIADRGLEGIASGYTGPVLYTDEIPGLPEYEGALPAPGPDDLFILLYTSGTTGKPKGVMLEHKNVLSMALFCNRAYGEDENSRMSAYASYGFDANMMDMYSAVTSGGTVYIIPEEMRLDLSELGEYFNESGITHSVITTQVGRQAAEELTFTTMKHMMVGGERLVPLEPPKGYVLHNGYGPTEGTVFCTEQPVDRLYHRIPVGKRISTYKLYVVDENGRRLPRGCKGELCISGPGVARGYLGRPEETKKAFRKNPFDDDPEFERLYRTGDIVRMLEDSNVDFIGRNDGQVKIRGFRVELSEIEEIVRRYPGVKDATVKDFTDPAGIKYVTAYVVSDEKLEPAKIKEFVGRNKPPYMVPAYVMQIDKIPLNQNQKVNKRALPEPEPEEKEIIAPENETQQKICDILAEILGHKNFGITTDVFEAGLTSVSSIRLNVRLSKAFGRAFSNSELADNPTVEALSKLAEGGEGTSPKTRPVQDSYPLTATQEGVFIECISSPGTTKYNIPCLFKLSDNIDPAKLEDAVRKTLEAHPYAMTKLFADDGGNIRARRSAYVPEVKRISGPLPEKAVLIRPFDILGGSLYRTEIYETPGGLYLFMDFHHIICDGSSMNILLTDISRAYLGEALKTEEYSGYEIALDEAEARGSEKYVKARQYFGALCGQADGEYLPKKELKHGEKGLKVSEYVSTLDPAGLGRFAADNNLTMNALFNFVFGVVLSKYSYREDALFATVYNGRNDSRSIDTVSMMVKTLPVYVKYSRDDAIIPLIAGLRNQLEESQRRDIYPFSEIASNFGVAADVMFIYQGDLFGFETIGGEKAEHVVIDSDEPKASLSLAVSIVNGALTFRFEYDGGLYTDGTTSSIFRTFETVMNSIRSVGTMGEISLLSKYDADNYDVWNATEQPVPEISFCDVFEAAVKANPDKTAVIAADGRYTYSELNAQANRIAHTLIKHGVKRGDKVAMLMPRVKDAYAVRQGILKAGAAFVPVDPRYPDDRVTYIIENSSATAILSTQNVLKDRKELIKAANVPAITVEEASLETDTSDPGLKLSPDDLSYIIYTSGSTGRPKGVMIRHANMVNYIQDGPNLATQAHRSTGGAVSCAFSSLSFDASVREEIVPLSHGYTAVIASEEDIENPLMLARRIIDNGVNMIFLTPSYISNALDFPQFLEAMRGLKVLDTGAEVVSPELIDKLRAAGVNAAVYNGYGPTEATITCSFQKITDKYITIGKPVANTKLYMLDTYGHILPPYAIGDLTIAGASVGAGYLNLPDKTAEKFITVKGLRAYRSGDMARINDEGNVEFFGRVDNQIKLHGLRIELDEIERVIAAYQDITGVVVVVKSSPAEGDYLAAYFTGRCKVDKEDLTKEISKRLTPYMVPKVMMQLERLPLTPNGKVDKRALPEPETAAENKKELTPPADELEAKLTSVFAKALNRGDIGADENFFDLGGTSLAVSKVAMLALTHNLPVAYSDVFDYPTPQALAAHIRGGAAGTESDAGTEATASAAENIAAAGSFEKNLPEAEPELSHNTVEFVDGIKDERPLGTVLLTGATGFLGSHILRELLRQNVHTVVLSRGGEIEADLRLRAMLAYYFDSPLDEELDRLVTVIDGDITNEDLDEKLAGIDVQTVINCAALVKHFAADDIIERINVGGVKNMIGVAKAKNARLIQISTLSVAGENIDGRFPKEFRMGENRLDVGQDVSNKYVHSKFSGERAVLDAIANGLDAKIVRAGNIMGRHSDGEFQINSVTNSFIRSLKGYRALGCFPVSACDSTVDFTPVDELAAAILKLARTGSDYTLFHGANSHEVQMGDVVEAMNRGGHSIRIVSDAEFGRALASAMSDPSRSMAVSGLITYSSSDARLHEYIKTDNTFTVKALYRLGFKWPITDEPYMTRMIDALDTLGYFDREDM